MDVDDRVAAGQAAYTPTSLKVYDWLVLGFSNRMLWRCPTAELEALYARNLSARHLDVGVGTGYFLDKADWPVPKPCITLLDLNPHSLAAAARRIHRLAPETLQANALAPLALDARFESVGLCYLLHCLPGAIAEKAVVFDHIKPAMTKGARLFGATIVPDGVHLSAAARTLMALYNRKGIFSNTADRLDDLRTALEARFDEVRLERRGAVALFEARRD